MKMEKKDTQSEIVHISTLVLRPLIRLLVHYGVNLQDFVEAVKRMYVEIAQERIKDDRERVTDSAISVMTGVHRKDVRRILEEFDGTRRRIRPPSVLGLVLQVWGGQSRFSTKRGAPRALRRRSLSQHAPSGDEATFEDLVAEVTKGIPPKALLDEWLRLGAVRLNSRGEVVYADPEFADGEEIGSLMRGMIVSSDRLTCSVENKTTGTKKRFVYSVRGSHMSDEDIKKVNALAERLSIQVSEKINVAVIAAEERGRATGKGSNRFSFGVHVLDEPMKALEKRGFSLW